MTFADDEVGFASPNYSALNQKNNSQ